MSSHQDIPAALVADREAAQQDALGDAALDAMWGQIDAEIEAKSRKAGPLTRLAEASRRTRLAILGTTLGLVGGALALGTGLRGDLHQAHTPLFVGAMVAYVTLLEASRGPEASLSSPAPVSQASCAFLLCLTAALDGGSPPAVRLAAFC